MHFVIEKTLDQRRGLIVRITHAMAEKANASTDLVQAAFFNVTKSDCGPDGRLAIGCRNSIH